MDPSGFIDLEARILAGTRWANHLETLLGLMVVTPISIDMS